MKITKSKQTREREKICPLFTFYVKDINTFEHYTEMVEHCNGELIYALMLSKYELDLFGPLYFQYILF